MYFYLDKKELIENNQIRCLWKDDKPISDTEKKGIIAYWGKQLKRSDIELVEYIADNLPAKLIFDIETNTVLEAPAELIQPLSETTTSTVIEKEFAEFDGKTYFYINKERAIVDGESETVFVSKRRLINYKEYYNNEVIEFAGNSCPYYVTYLTDFDTVREATEYEKYSRGQRKLEENEVVIESKKEIVSLADGQYVENDEVITIPCPPEFLVKKWHKDTRVWEDLTTDLDRVEAQYREYEGMDTPSTVQEMRLEDEAMAEEFINMLIELRGLIYTLKVQGISNVSDIPMPSEKLLNFKNKFKLVR